MINRLIKESGFGARELILHYKSFSHELLPEEVHRLHLESPDSMLNGIAIHKEELDTLNNTSIQELIQRDLARQKEWNKKAEDRVTTEDILFREKAKATITELEKWEPESASSKYVKIKLIEKIKSDLKGYFEEVYGISEPYTEEESKRRILERKSHLEWYIKQLESKYPIAVKCNNQVEQFESELMKDLKLLGL